MRVKLCPVDGGHFVVAIDDVPDLALDEGFGFADEVDEIIFIDVSGQHEVNHGAVETVGQLADEVDFTEFAEALDDGVYDLVKADVLDEDIVDLAVKRVMCIGLEVFAVAFGVGGKQSGFFKAVEFLSYGIGGIAKLCFESPEVGTGAAVEEKLQKEFDPRFGRNEGLDHGVSNDNE